VRTHSLDQQADAHPSRKINPVIEKSAAITTAAIRGKKNVILTIDLGASVHHGLPHRER
jgi:hypothetical protein